MRPPARAPVLGGRRDLGAGQDPSTSRARIEAKGGLLAEFVDCTWLCLITRVAALTAFLAVLGGPLGRAAVDILAIHWIARAAHELLQKLKGGTP